MQQQVLIVTPIALFEIADGKTIEKGNCACAVVAYPAVPPKFSLLCYNDKRETLCVSSISSSNEHSLQFQLQVSGYASFRDDKGKKWSMMFLKTAQLDKFCATLGAALFAAAGQPTHSAVIGDFAPPKGETKLDVSHRCKLRYSAFSIRKSAATGDIPVVDEVIETNGDRAYNFQPVQSAMAILPDGRGFESSVLGMMEDTTRTIVVPATMPRAGKHPYTGQGIVVFVVQLIRILHDNLNSSPDVPTVFGSNSLALVVPSSTELSPSSGALVAVSANTKEAADERPTPHLVGGVGSGIPAEHMAMVQKAASQINTVTTSTRDLHDKVVSFQEDWKQSVNRPKPSALTNQSLEQNVKQLIMENERIRDDIISRDELIKSLDERNRDLQKRVDRAAMIAQQLMDEKQQTVAGTSDLKLEKDRVIMKLQEQITHASSERDDVQRHLLTVKKLLEVADNELRETRGKIDVHMVQAQGLASKLDVAEDALAEERSRRKAFEAKVQALQEEIRNADAELHIKAAQLEDVRRKADSERTHLAQIMEDERQRRGFEAQQLRSEIVGELQQREQKFQADRARTAEDNFKRGHEEGKEIGRRGARIDVEARVEELVLDAQRARTELDAYKTELRQATEDSMAENRRLENIVNQLKKSADEATRKKAQGEFQLHAMRLKVRNAEDALLLGLTSIAHRLTRPAAPQDLVEVLQALKNCENPNLSFQQEKHQQEAQESYNRRYQIIFDELEAGYQQVIDQEYTSLYLSPLVAAHQHTNSAVSALWTARDVAQQQAISDEEAVARSSVDAESDSFFLQLEALRTAQAEERLAVEQAATSALASLVEEEAIFIPALIAYADAQRVERGSLVAAAESALNGLVVEEAGEWKSIQQAHEMKIYEKIIAEQQSFFDAEGDPRQGIEAEEDGGRTELAELVPESLKEAEDLQAARLEREAAQAEEIAAEASGRSAIEAEEASENSVLQESKPTPPPRKVDEEVVFPKEAPNAVNRNSVTTAQKQDLDLAAAMAAAVVETKQQKSAFGGDSDSDDGGFAAKKAASPPAAKKAPAAAAVAAANLFGSDDEDDAPKAKAPPKKAARKVVLKQAKMFDSDDD